MFSSINTTRVLVIGDLHTPFEHSAYLAHCKQVAKQFRTTHTIFIGDVIDAHFSSYHETNPDGYGAGEELRRAVEKLKQWHKAFPNAEVILGNHDRMAMRKVQTAGLSSKWLRSIEEVLETPSWSYHMRRVYDGVLYIHGEGVTARTKVLRSNKSVVQGHRHTEGYVWYVSTEDKPMFGMQVGTGIDAEAYAFTYAKDQPPPVLSCGVVLDKGTTAHLIPMV